MTGSRGGPSSSGPPPGTALQPQDPVTVGQIRGWIDAMRPELGLRDEVADLIVLAWAALRQRAWYQHGASIPAPRPGRPARTWSCGRSRCPFRLTGRPRRRAPRCCSGSGQPVPDGAGLAEFTESLRARLDAVADSATALVPRVEQAYRHLDLPADRPGRLGHLRAGAALGKPGPGEFGGRAT